MHSVLHIQAVTQREPSIIIYDKWNKLSLLPFAGGGESFEPPQPITALGKFLNHPDNLTLVGQLISIPDWLMTSSARNYVLSFLNGNTSQNQINANQWPKGCNRIANEFSTILSYIIGPLQNLPDDFWNLKEDGFSTKWKAEVEKKWWLVICKVATLTIELVALLVRQFINILIK